MPSYKEVHVMLDLETLGLVKNAVITRIAAVAFNIDDGTVEDEIDIRVNAKSCVNAGLKIEGSTVEWWLKQDEKLIQDTLITSFFEGEPLSEALQHFTLWIEGLKKKYDTWNVMVWGNGACADNTWMHSAYQACHLDVPWKFYQDRDLRTLVYLGQVLTGFSHKKTLLFEGQRHNPIDDCKHQITYAVATLTALKAAMHPKSSSTSSNTTAGETQAAPVETCV